MIAGYAWPQSVVAGESVALHCSTDARRFDVEVLRQVNPYRIPHDEVMQTIEMMGRYVIPEFRGRASTVGAS